MAAFAYVRMHLLLYAASEMFDLRKDRKRDRPRVYLTIGFPHWSGCGVGRDLDGRNDPPPGGQALAATVRLVYAIAVLAVIHYCFQSKLDLWEPTIMAGWLGWLLATGCCLAGWQTRASGVAVGWGTEPL